MPLLTNLIWNQAQYLGPLDRLKLRSHVVLSKSKAEFHGESQRKQRDLTERQQGATSGLPWE